MIIKSVSLDEVLRLLGHDVLCVYGRELNEAIDNLADVAHTTASTLDWINPAKSNPQAIAEGSKARVLLVDNQVEYSDTLQQQGKTLIVVKNPKVALAKVGNQFFVEHPAVGIHPTAVVDSKAEIGEGVHIGPYAVVGRAKIGKGCVVSAGVRIYDDVELGEGCVVKEGAVIGGAGFGFERDDEGNLFRFPQIGGVKIGQYVEIGANTCIDRGALSDTVIGDHTKIDNLVHIAHNVQIGRNAMVIACSEVSGSCVVGDDVWISPNSAVRDWRRIGNGALVGLGSVVVKDVPEGEVWAGNPARKLK